MEVILRRRPQKTISDLPAGTVFIFNDRFFMKTDSKLYCVNLQTGQYLPIPNEAEFKEVEAELYVTA